MQVSNAYIKGTNLVYLCTWVQLFPRSIIKFAVSEGTNHLRQSCDRFEEQVEKPAFMDMSLSWLVSAGCSVLAAMANGVGHIVI